MTLVNWQSCEAPGQWPLTGARVILEPLDWGLHGEGLFGAVAGEHNGAIWDYMPIGPFGDLSSFQKIFEDVCGKFGWEALVIKSAVGDTVLGMASYMRIRETHGSAEVGCVAFGDTLKRSSEATEAMFLMAQHVFDELKYRRYEWKCNNSNEASKRAAIRFGFAFEGVFRNDMVVDGQSRDTAWYAMTDDDWPILKAGYERWLAPDNFDADGRQVQALAAFREG